MYLGHIGREAEASANPRERSVTEPALMSLCCRTKWIARSTGKMAGGDAYLRRERGGRHELPTNN